VLCLLPALLAVTSHNTARDGDRVGERGRGGEGERGSMITPTSTRVLRTDCPPDSSLQPLVGTWVLELDLGMKRAQVGEWAF
jgi:hypothetical protein